MSATHGAALRRSTGASRATRHALLGIVAGLALALSSQPGVAGATATVTPLMSSYIVVVKAGIDPGPFADSLAAKPGHKIMHRYRSALNGFAVTLPPVAVGALKANPHVSYVEPDYAVTATGQTLPAGVNRIDADLSTTKAGNGSGAVGDVNAYVIDTGISPHPDLNIVGHKNWTGDGKYYDCNGHGTHVAGIIGARDNASYVVGAAPGVALTDLIAAVDWVAANAKKPAVVNLSLSGNPSAALDSAVNNAAGRGVLMVIAGADNGVIIIVAATDSTNAEASFSNYGPCIDIWAPGVSITSTYNNGGTATMSGTSMAAPHVTGAGALYEAMYRTTYMPSAEKVLKSRVIATGKLSKDNRAIKVVYARSY